MTDNQMEIFSRLKKAPTMPERILIGIELVSTISDDDRPHFCNHSLNDIEEEVWRDIPKYEGIYKASSFGRVKSFYRAKKGERQILSCKIGRDGYLMVNLSNKDKVEYVRVHTILRRCFNINGVGNDINHLNGIKIDNRICNLENSTRKRNIQHAYDNGLNKGSINCLGRKRYNAVLNDDLVFKIRTKIEEGVKRCIILEELGITVTSYASVQRGAWRHVKI